MRSLVIAGLVLAALGAFALLRGVSYGSRHNMMQVGDLKVVTEEQQAVPQWAGGIAVAAGLVLIGVGAFGRRRP